MKGTVIIRRVIAIKAILDHLIDEPTVDPFVEMRRFYSEEQDPQRGGEAENQPEHPIAFECVQNHLSGIGRSPGKIRSRLFATAASTRSDAHFGNGWLRLHRQQLYSLHSETLQASLHQ